MPTLKFYVSPNDESCRVKLRYTYNRNSRCDFFCGVSLSSIGNFDRDNELNPIKKKEADSQFKNNQLIHTKRLIEDIIQSLNLNKKTPTAELVKRKFKSAKVTNLMNTDIQQKINSYFIVSTINEYINHLRSRVRIGDNLRLTSFKKIDRMMDKWEQFFEFKKQRDIQFEDLRYRYLLFREFAEWCLNKKNNFANSSINKYSSTFRSFLRWAKKMDYHNIDIERFDSPNLKEVSNSTILALTPIQLNLVYGFKKIHYLNENGSYNKICEDYTNPNDRYFIIEDKFVQKEYSKEGICTETNFSKKYTSLEVYKDFFCFQCSTSLAYIDAANIKITDYDFSKDCFELIRIKTSAPTTIPMNEMSRAIWMKYSKDKNGKRKDGNPIDKHYLFPRMKEDKFYTNQNCNDGLKRIGFYLKEHLSNMVNVEKRSGSGFKDGTDIEVPLYEILHTHMGRKTFINFALSQKIAPIDIRKISGHSDDKMMKHYVNSLRDEVKEEFQTMGAFIGGRDFVGPKGKKLLKDSKEEKMQILLNQKRSGFINEVDFNKHMIALLKLK